MKGKLSAVILAAVMLTGATAFADYDYTAAEIGKIDGVGEISIEKLSGNVVTVWRTTYSGANMNSYTALVTAYDLTGGAVTETIPYIYEEIPDSVNKIAYYKRGSNDTGNIFCAGYAIVDANNNFIIPADEYDYMKAADDGTVIAGKNKKYSLLSADGAVIEGEIDAHEDKPRYRAPYSFGAQGDGFLAHRGSIIDFTGREIISGYRDAVRLDNGIIAALGEGNMLYMLQSGTIDIAYNTDVRTRINNEEIACYNVGGRTAIVAEDLGDYGFDILWNGENHTLSITRNPEYYTINPVTVPEKSGNLTPYADIVQSDIKTYYNGNEIKSYHINGRTLILVDDMADSGVTVSHTDGAVSIAVDGLEWK